MNLPKNTMILEMFLQQRKIWSIGRTLVNECNFKNWWKSERIAMRRAINDLSKIRFSYEKHLTEEDMFTLKLARKILWKLESSVDHAIRHSTGEMTESRMAEAKERLRIKTNI